MTIQNFYANKPSVVFDLNESYGDVRIVCEGRIIDVTYEDERELIDLFVLEDIEISEFRYPADLKTQMLHAVLASKSKEVSIKEIRAMLIYRFQGRRKAMEAAEDYLNGYLNPDWPLLEQAIDRAGEFWRIESYLEKLPQQRGWKLTRVGRVLSELVFGIARVKSID